MKLFLTDDHAMMVGGLVSILNDEEGFEVVGTAGSARETLDKLTQLSPDLIVLDYHLPDEDGLSLVKKIKRKYPQIKMLMLSMHDETHLIQEIIKTGVDGYVEKGFP